MQTRQSPEANGAQRKSVTNSLDLILALSPDQSQRKLALPALKGGAGNVL